MDASDANPPKLKKCYNETHMLVEAATREERKDIFSEEGLSTFVFYFHAKLLLLWLIFVVCFV